MFIYIIALIAVSALLVYFYLNTIFSAQIRLEDSRIGSIEDTETTINNAIVVGGSISGILAASTIAPLSKNVYILEKRKIPDSCSVAAQGEQVHVILARGIDIMSKLFPDFSREILKKGAHFYDIMHDCRSIGYGGMKAVCEKGEGGIYGFSVSRACVEVTLRSLMLKKFKNVHIIDEAEVSQLKGNAEHITGVIYKDKDQNVQTLDSDLFVDASGLYGLLSKQLKKQYNTQIETKKVRSFIEYVSCRYKPNDGFLIKHPLIYYQGHPPDHPYGGISQHLENGDVIIMFGQYKTSFIPTLENFEQFFEDKKMDRIVDIIRNSKPTCNVYTYKKEGSQYSYFENMKIKGAIALGDAVCSFNPIYGQGMTCAAEGCLLMDNMMRSGSFNCHEFQARLSKIVTLPWLLATNADLCFPGTEGGNAIQRLMIPNTIKDSKTMSVKCVQDKEFHADLTSILHMAEGAGWKLVFPLWIRKIFKTNSIKANRPVWVV